MNMMCQHVYLWKYPSHVVEWLPCFLSKSQGTEAYSRRWRSAADFDRPCVATRSDSVWLFEVSGGSPQAPLLRQSLGLHPSEVKWSQKIHKHTHTHTCFLKGLNDIRTSMLGINLVIQQQKMMGDRSYRLGLMNTHFNLRGST